MLQLAGTAIDALSCGGWETCIQLPGLDVMFDVGRCPRTAVHRSRVLFTHAHVDHMGGVVAHCATRSMLGLTPPTYVVPAENVEAFEDLLAVWRRLDRSDLPCAVIPARPGEDIPLGRNLCARPFRSVHRVPTLGYALWRTTRKLRRDLVGLTTAQVRARAMAGEGVTEASEYPEVAFTGDTRIEVLEREAVVRQARLLIMELTFLDERVTVDAARSTGHIHLDEVIARAELFENRSILFTHVSARYGGAEAAEILARRLPASLQERVTLLPNGR